MRIKIGDIVPDHNLIPDQWTNDPYEDEVYRDFKYILKLPENKWYELCDLEIYVKKENGKILFSSTRLDNLELEEFIRKYRLL